MLVHRTCEWCGTAFDIGAWEVRRGSGKFCIPEHFYAATAARPFTERLEAKTDKNGPLPDYHPEFGQCWLWTAYCLPGGYGLVSSGARGVRGAQLLAHRAAWWAASGEKPPRNRVVLHICDHPGCVRNDTRGVYTVDGVELPRFGHLALGTNADNNADAVAKGRSQPIADKVRPELVQRGELRWNAVLTAEAVQAIRLRFDTAIQQRGMLPVLAREYGVSTSRIHGVVRRKTWKHVPEI